MKRAIVIFSIYFISLLLFSIFFSLLNISNFTINLTFIELPVSSNMVIIIIGGIISIYLTVSIKSFKLFLLIYTFLWILRFAVLYMGNQVGEIVLWDKIIKVNNYIKNYYENVSRIGSPLFFPICWLINTFFSKQEK